MIALRLQTGVPRAYSFQGKTIRSSMTRDQVHPQIEVKFKGVVGDEFAAPAIHGAEDSRLYMMGEKFYSLWSARLGKTVSLGEVGENVSLQYLDEALIFCGDRFRFGSCEIEARAPRIPCSKLNFVFQSESAQKTFVELETPGVYFKVLKEGFIHQGDQLEKIGAGGAVSILEMYQVYHGLRQGKVLDRQQLQKIVADPFVALSYRQIVEPALLK